MLGRSNLLWILFFSILIFLGASGVVFGKYLDSQIASKAQVSTDSENLMRANPSSAPEKPVASVNVPSSYELPGAQWIPQTYNNCGPAATAMLLQDFGHNVSQVETKAALRPNGNDKNVTLKAISGYLSRSFGLNSHIFYGGNVDRAKLLISQGYYLMVEDWLHPDEDIGHVLILRGYDDTTGVFIADDSYFGVGIKYPYDTFVNHQWKAFDYEYMPVYRPDKESQLKSLVGEDWDDTVMYGKALAQAQADAVAHPQDVYVWFNVGTSAYGLGKYQLAGEAFDKAIAIGLPGRMLWYQTQPVDTYNKLGQTDKAKNLPGQL